MNASTIRNILFFFSLFMCTMTHTTHKVGLLVVATGRYIQFVEPLLASADKHFLPEQEVTYVIFTDQPVTFQENIQRNIIRVEQKRLGWPYDTMMRLAMYAQQKELLQAMDYLFACDADMLFVDTVGNEIIGERVATQHPGFVGKRGTYETRKTSTAYIAPDEGSHYFAGGFNGGSSKEFLTLAETITHHIEIDLSNNIIAIWHDESHLNRYFIDTPPTVILNPSYCYPESWKLPYPKKLLALDKNHAEIREQ